MKSTPVLSLLAVVCAVSIVYAAVSTSATGGGAVTQFTTNWGDCRNITNNNSRPFFVPANTLNEWNNFISNAPNKSLTACCAGNYGQACNSGANACGQTNAGTYDCAGVCSASVPANPAGYGNACNSSPNACSETNAGTIQCNGSCSANTPPNPAGYGSGCSSEPNNCGWTNSGTTMCNGLCSASAPGDVGDRYVCSDPFCVNSDEVCQYDEYGMPYGCYYECVDWAQNCGWESGC